MLYILNNPNNFVPVSKEVDFIKNYVELMCIGLADKVEVKTEVQKLPDSERLIAPMIFIPLIENAFKHGVKYTQPSFIHINIHTVEDRIICMIRNSYFPKDKNDKSNPGVSVENLQRRLDLLYPQQHIFRSEQKDNTYMCELIIPLR